MSRKVRRSLLITGPERVDMVKGGPEAGEMVKRDAEGGHNKEEKERKVLGVSVCAILKEIDGPCAEAGKISNISHARPTSFDGIT